MPTSAYNPGFMYSNSLPSTGITAKQSMQYQEYLANTSHQRQMADLKAAGLNPWLADVSGAPTPTGQTDDASVLSVLSGAVSALSHAVGKRVEEEEQSDILNILMALGMKKNQAEAIVALADRYGIVLTAANVAAFASDPWRYIQNNKSSARSSVPGQGNPRHPATNRDAGSNFTGVRNINGTDYYYVDGKRVSYIGYRWTLWKRKYG